MTTQAVIALFLIALTACIFIIKRYSSTIKQLESKTYRLTVTNEQLAQQVINLAYDRDMLRDVIDTPHNPIFVIDSELRLIFVNQGMADTFELPIESMLGMSLDALIPDLNQLQKLRADTNHMLTLGQTSNISEFTIYDKKNNDHTYYSLTRRVLHGGQQGVVIVGTDITTLKQVITHYVDLQERYAKLIENSHNLILQIAPDWRITYANPVCQKILGLSQAECLRKTWLDIIHPGDHQRLKAQFGRWSFMVKRKEEPNWEFRIVTATGEVKQVLWGITIYWNGDIFEGIQADGTDITQYEQSEIALLEAHKELQRINSIYERAIQTMIAPAQG